MMLFLHLFKNAADDAALGYIFLVGDTPLIYYISRMCNPVPFFLILSGYGLYFTYSKMGVKSCKRVSNMYVHLWIIYLLLLPLGCWVRPDFYPGSAELFIKNATSWQCSYIGEQWFFLPYIILMLASSLIFKLYDRLKWYWIIGITLTAWAVTIFVLKRYSGDTLSSNMLFYNVFLAVFMLPSFSLGYMANKYAWFDRVKRVFERLGSGNALFPMIALLSLCVLRCFVPNQSVGSYFVIVFVLLFVQIPINKTIGSILTYLGKHSMNLWLIHTWFCTRLFHNFFFDQIHYPILIYFSLLAVSLLVSHAVEWIYKPISRFINEMQY